MFFQGFSEYEDVVQIHHYNSFRNQVFEDSIHHQKGGRTIHQSKEHYERLIEASVGSEGCLPFVSIFHPYIVKSPACVKLSKILSSLQLIDKFRNQWKCQGNLQSKRRKTLERV